MFSLGDAIMPMLNALDIDVFLPGNWDFGWGPRVYRQRFTLDTTTMLSPNNRTTLAWMDGRPGHEGQRCKQAGGLIPYAQCHVTRANFPAVAINLYDYDEAARVQGARLHDPHVIADIDGVKVAVVGITSDSVPHQARAFNVVAPANAENIFDPTRTPVLLKVAPDNFVHPVDALRWYLQEGLPGSHDVTAAAHESNMGTVTLSSDSVPSLIQRRPGQAALPVHNPP